MESPPLAATLVSQKSKKRVFPEGGSSCMEPEVAEIMPPIARASDSKPLKHKEVLHEIIDIDMDEDSGDVMVIDKNVESFIKGKEALPNFLFSPTSAAKVVLVDGDQSSKNFGQGSPNSINLDGFSSDLSFDEDEYIDIFTDGFSYEDEYAFLQAHFDNVDIPPGVEAPIPWLQKSLHSKEKAASVSSSLVLGSEAQKDASILSSGKSPIQSWCKSEPALTRKKITSASVSSFPNQKDAASPSFESDQSTKIQQLTEQVQSKKKYTAMNPPYGVKPSRSWCFPEPSHGKKKPTASSGPSFHLISSAEVSSYPHELEPYPWVPCIPNGSNVQTGTVSSTNLSSHKQMGTLKISSSHGEDPSKSWFPDLSKMKKKSFIISDPVYSGFYDTPNALDMPSEEDAFIPWIHDVAKRKRSATAAGSSTIPSESTSIKDEDENKDDILKKFQLFKQFDTVQVHSDHHYSGNGSSLKQPSKNWAKKIQEEWKILEKDLPDTIHVRVYETRLDLLRAVIIGAEGTPYHDGLFFFDVFFPSNYPNVPPLVYYHSGGLRLNPNLYNCGKVCLSLLNTWSGDKNEMWIPGVSTILQVLVSIQGLILNAKPFFNEPGFASMSGSESGEMRSRQYNETTFILSLKTMLYAMKRPPMHFEDFVVGHFCKHAHDILVACKAYMDGAQVGCLVKGGVQDVDEGDKSCSKKFKDCLAGYIKLLVKAFTQLGVKDCEKFLSSQIG